MTVEKVKILRVINRFNIGGPTYNATFLSRFLDDKYETMLVGGLPDVGESDSLYILEKYGVKPVLIEEMVRQPNLTSDRKAYKRLKELIREFKPDIVHTHASKAGALGRKAAFACNVPIVVHTFHGHVFHSYFGKGKTMIFKSIERSLAKRSTAIIAISDKQKDELVHQHKICKADKVTVIPLGFDLIPFNQKRRTQREAVRTELELKEDELAIGIIGRFAPIKNHDFFFDMIESILPRITKKVKIFVVGDGTEREKIEERVKKINSKHNNIIKLTSWVTDIARFNSAMDIICLTSKNEGTPVSLIEAQAGGIPVVTTDVGGVRDIIVEGDTGYIVPKDDISPFGERLLDLIENEKKREKMSQNGWNHVKEKFHYETLVRNMDKFYQELLRKNK
jgi:glycosyltransferase involved in cell wall biosynthesis